jgi:glyoxylase-like metal-dependent hydrolase (beta-lactamase superfamily II)
MRAILTGFPALSQAQKSCIRASRRKKVTSGSAGAGPHAPECRRLPGSLAMKHWTGIAIGVIACCNGYAAGAAPTTSTAGVVPVAPGVDLIPGLFVPNQQPDGNSVIFRTAAGLVVVDTGRHVEHTQKILDYAKSSGLPIVAVVNSHWHLDHVSGNPRVRAAYPAVRVYASGAIEEAMSGFLANYRKQLEGAIAQSKDEAQIQSWRDEIARIDGGRALYPDVEITKSAKQRLGGRDFRLHLETHAATAGDVWLYDPQSRVLAVGDLVTLPVPFLDTACPAQWKVALDDVAHADFRTLIPGHGPPMQRAQFETWRKAYGNLVACASSSNDKGVCADGWLADAKPLLADADPRFVKSLLDYYVDNSLRAPKEKIDKLCSAVAAARE